MQYIVWLCMQARLQLRLQVSDVWGNEKDSGVPRFCCRCIARGLVTVKLEAQAGIRVRWPRALRQRGESSRESRPNADSDFGMESKRSQVSRDYWETGAG